MVARGRILQARLTAVLVDGQSLASMEGFERRREASDDDGFLVFAEDAAEGVGDFADGGVGFDGVEDGGEEIFGRRGAALEFGERGLRFGCESRLARRAFRRAIWERSISGSMRSVGMGRSSSAMKSFTPTMICSLDSTARWKS